MRNAYRKMKQDSASLLSMDETISSEKAGTAEEQVKRRQTILEDGVGDEDEIGEFGLGRAVKEAKPVSKIELSKAKEAEIAAMEQWEEYAEVDDENVQVQEEAVMLARMRRSKASVADRRPPTDR